MVNIQSSIVESEHDFVNIDSKNFIFSQMPIEKGLRQTDTQTEATKCNPPLRY